MSGTTAMNALMGFLVIAVVVADRYWPRRPRCCERCAKNAIREALEMPIGNFVPRTMSTPPGSVPPKPRK